MPYEKLQLHTPKYLLARFLQVVRCVILSYELRGY